MAVLNRSEGDIRLVENSERASNAAGHALEWRHTMSAITVTVDPLDHDVKDPSCNEGDTACGCGTVQVVKITNDTPDPDPGDILVTKEDQEITFVFLHGTPTEYLFTGFRYLRIHIDGDNLEYGQWAAPSNDPNWKGELGVRISYTPDTASNLRDCKGTPSMTIVDTNNYNVIYLYLVEYTDGHQKFVFDPKIKNEPSGTSWPIP